MQYFPGHLFCSDIFFYVRESYFAEPRVLTPLLHTCSLSVEEQFYLLFPLLMMLVWARSALTPFLAVGMVVSLWLAIYTRHSDPSEIHARHCREIKRTAASRSYRGKNLAGGEQTRLTRRMRVRS